MRSQRTPERLKIAVIGTGISGLGAAWLLSPRHDVVLYEAESRLGGHSHTVEVEGPDGVTPVDTGFIVYNDANYPNLSALFRHLGVPTQVAPMSFGVSLDEGGLEYGSAHPLALFAQPANLFRFRFWSMMGDLVRFYRDAPRRLDALCREPQTLGEMLDRGRYGLAFQEDHLLPQVGAIWSTSPEAARDHPAEALVRFFDNHGLLRLLHRPQWRTVVGGSRTYVERLACATRGEIRLGAAVLQVARTGGGVLVRSADGRSDHYDRVVIATHADQALRMLATPSSEERATLGAFRYSRNLVLLHRDEALMPRRRAAWSAWNHIGRTGAQDEICVTYWMNLLQSLPRRPDLFVTLNPRGEPRPEYVIRRMIYEHPMFDRAALDAQQRLWSLQGRGGLWYCGAHFGAGFHEDGLQAGLAVAEQLGGVRRPWTVDAESARITLGKPPRETALEAVA